MQSRRNLNAFKFLFQEDIVVRGIAVQCRVTTENPERNFAPDTGTLSVYRHSAGAKKRGRARPPKDKYLAILTMLLGRFVSYKTRSGPGGDQRSSELPTPELALTLPDPQSRRLRHAAGRHRLLGHGGHALLRLAPRQVHRARCHLGRGQHWRPSET
jgi:hypothetical protein